MYAVPVLDTCPGWVRHSCIARYSVYVSLQLRIRRSERHCTPDTYYLGGGMWTVTIVRARAQFLKLLAPSRGSGALFGYTESVRRVAAPGRGDSEVYQRFLPNVLPHRGDG